MADIPRVLFEYTGLLKDAYNCAQEHGHDLTLLIRDEDEVTRDKYNSIKKRDFLTLPGSVAVKGMVTFNPTDNQLRKAGIRERVDVVIKIPVTYLTLSSLTYEDIDVIRTTVILENETYKIKEKNKTGRYGNNYIFIVLGLFRL